ncbi:MAG: DNA-binding response regulator, partial [Bacillota bacterium]
MKDPRPPLLLVDDHPGVRRLIPVGLRALAA